MSLLSQLLLLLLFALLPPFLLLVFVPSRLFCRRCCY